MKEIHAIIKAYQNQYLAGNQSALATLVHLDGSSYRRPGARLLVDDAGNMTGAISGGCLEGDAYRKAAQAIASKKPRLVTYDTSDEDDATIGVQLGCAGIIRVLFEPIDLNDAFNPIRLLESAAASRDENILVTLFSNDPEGQHHQGTKFIFQKDLTIIGKRPEEKIFNRLKNEAEQVFNNRKSAFLDLESFETSAFIEYLPPPVSLVIVGAGNDAIPLAEMAEIMGWDVVVVDGRNHLAKQERFTPSCQIVVSKPEQVLDRLRIDHRTAFVLMTHNYKYDLAMLKALSTREVNYVGMLGPKKKFDNMLADLNDEGHVIPDRVLSRIHAPIGLEIGAETPEEIALSIISEIKAVFGKAPGGFLRDKPGPIHHRESTDISYSKTNS
ncbi:MAG: XdhC family protein [Saprospiraceae bacterium]|nr:XdhC family protein [Saprospiraceae bacterium]